MKILIPPSESKNARGTGKPLGKISAKVIERLEVIPKANLERFYNVKGTALEAAVAANETLATSPTLPAIKRYKGVVYTGIDYITMSKEGKKFFDTHILIVSGLFGLLKPKDWIPDYKFKMQKGENFVVSDFCLDLLPQLHSSSVSYEKGQRVDFIFLESGMKKIAGHAGKLIKGKFIRWLCENQITDIKRFSEFSDDGFAWENGVFVKEV
jgi:cytoplasmic iron level regulating protein YaaA (DUF328/UPF0246 family)